MGQNQSRRATGDHFYTTNFKGELAAWSGYEREDLECFVYLIAVPETVPVYRWYKAKDNIQDHFYTTNRAGEAARASGYVYEGIAFYLFPTQQPDTVALNRWYHPQIGDHFYTTHPTGELAPAAGYVREGITGYVFTSQLRGSVQLYRWYHSRKFNFTFGPNISPEQQQQIWERHTWAYYRAGKCTHLSQIEKDTVRHIYENDTIKHNVETNPQANASAQIGGRFINVNFNVLFPQGDNEIAMSLLHEMMHCAGYDHPFPKSDPRYFNTVPLNAEKCIAGYASDAASPAVGIAHGKMNEDGTLVEPQTKVLSADRALTISGCGVVTPSEAKAEPKTNIASGSPAADLVGDAAGTVAGSQATSSIAYNRNVLDPYKHDLNKGEARGLRASN